MSVDRLSSGGLVSWWKKALSQTEGRRKASIVLILKEGCQPHDFIEPVTLGGGKGRNFIDRKNSCREFLFLSTKTRKKLVSFSRNRLPILIFSARF